MDTGYHAIIERYGRGRLRPPSPRELKQDALGADDMKDQRTGGKLRAARSGKLRSSRSLE
jgi:hypothetical protein